jgi:hypothetical protein
MSTHGFIPINVSRGGDENDADTQITLHDLTAAPVNPPPSTYCVDDLGLEIDLDADGHILAIWMPTKRVPPSLLSSLEP